MGAKIKDYPKDPPMGVIVRCRTNVIVLRSRTRHSLDARHGKTISTHEHFLDLGTYDDMSQHSYKLKLTTDLTLKQELKS